MEMLVSIKSENEPQSFRKATLMFEINQYFEFQFRILRIRMKHLKNKMKKSLGV